MGRLVRTIRELHRERSLKAAVVQGAVRKGYLDAEFIETVLNAAQKFALDDPLFERARAHDELDHHSGVGEGVDTQHLGLVQNQRPELRFFAHCAREFHQDLHHLVHILLVGHADIQHHPRPAASEIADGRDLTVRDEVGDTFEVPQGGHSQVDVLDDPVFARMPISCAVVIRFFEDCSCKKKQNE